MIKQEILNFINANPVFFLATEDAGKPYVRGMMIIEANENGILFSTGKQKDLHQQLSKNQHVELCFYDPKMNKQIRVNGTVELTEDMDTKKKVLAKFPFLKPAVEKYGYDILAPYYLRKGKAVMWTFETNFEPKKFIDI
ncbi:MAG: pyridoxamine 5'-phosphate oxidase family protein [Nitrospirota bacterium]